MDFFVYIIYSVKLDAFYVGQAINVQQRINEHNSGFYKDTSTNKTNDWTLFYSLKCDTRKQAILIERHIKKMHSRKYYNNLIMFPEIGMRLFEKYQTD